MAMRRWDPFNEMMTLRDAMDRLIQDSFVRPSGTMETGSMLSGAMPIDMYDEGNNLVVKTSMPGVRPEDVNIEVQNETLTITGQVTGDEEQGTPPQAQQTQGQQRGTQTQGQASQTQGQPSQAMTAQQNRNLQRGGQQNWYIREHRYTQYMRTVTLPYPVQADKAQATMENGVLTIRFPKAEQAKAKQIPVKTK